MDTHTILEKLYQYGHLFAGVRGSDYESAIPNMDLTSADAKAAIASYQGWYGEFFQNDDIAALLSKDRCGCPDIVRVDNQFLLAAAWPESCRELTTSYRLQIGDLTPDQIESDWLEADRNWSDVLMVDFLLQNDRYPNTSLYAFTARLPGSVLADQVLPRAVCEQRLRGRYDSRRWSIENLFVTTITHEKGHGIGLGHSSDSRSTMFASITPDSMERRGALHETDIQMALRIGYQMRDLDPPPPDGISPERVVAEVLSGERRLDVEELIRHLSPAQNFCSAPNALRKDS